MSRPRIVFFGTPKFALPSLDILLKEGYEIPAVITAPDKPAGRGQQLQQSAVKQYAAKHGLPIMQPASLKDKGFLSDLENLKADLQVIVAFRMLPDEVWAMPSLGTFNLHASLLPQYRGAAPINWCIINGETETGITTFFLDHQIDTGIIIFREKVAIRPDDTAGTLHDKLMALGAQLVLETVQAITSGNCPLTDQHKLIKKNEPLKQAPKITKADCRIEWGKSIVEINNLIRGLSPHPAAWTELEQGDKKNYIKIYDATPSDRQCDAEPGCLQIVDNALYAATGNGWLQILEVQQAGKKRMAVSDFLRGSKLDSKGKFN